MLKKQLGKAFTLIELLVVVAIIALLIAILLPSLKRAKDSAKKAVCLAHLKDIGSAAHEYASEDERNMIMPLSPIMVRDHAYWLKRAVMWYTWGGRGATERFYTSTDGGPWVNERNNRPYYGTRQRPLTTYMYPNIEAGKYDPTSDIYTPSEAPVFECPGDKGYPELEGGVIDDVPEALAGYRLFDTTGNSYRGSLAYVASSGGGGGATERLSIGVWGQRLDALQETSQMLWGGDPLFYNFIGTDSASAGWPVVQRYGWHGEFMISNELYVDGSARPTQAVADDDPEWIISQTAAAEWGVTGPGWAWLHRGPGWRLDAFPTGGVVFGDWNPAGESWPFAGKTVTPPPVGGWD